MTKVQFIVATNGKDFQESLNSFLQSVSHHNLIGIQHSSALAYNSHLELASSYSAIVCYQEYELGSDVNEIPPPPPPPSYSDNASLNQPPL